MDFLYRIRGVKGMKISRMVGGDYPAVRQGSMV